MKVSLNDLITEYQYQLSKGQIQQAYQAIMAFMSALRSYLHKQYPQHSPSAFYPGYMDMTYFAFTPEDFKKKALKIAIVYLHEMGTFSIWLGGSNRKVQSRAIDYLRHKQIDPPYRLSQVAPGVDSIIELDLVDVPNFDHPETLMGQIESAYNTLVSDIRPLLSDFDNNQ